MTSNQSPSNSIDWPRIDQMLIEGRLKLDAVSKTFKMKSADLKAALVERYGNTIVFKRGRNGGVYINPKPRSVSGEPSTINNPAV